MLNYNGNDQNIVRIIRAHNDIRGRLLNATQNPRIREEIIQRLILNYELKLNNVINNTPQEWRRINTVIINANINHLIDLRARYHMFPSNLYPIPEQPNIPVQPAYLNIPRPDQVDDDWGTTGLRILKPALLVGGGALTASGIGNIATAGLKTVGKEVAKGVAKEAAKETTKEIAKGSVKVVIGAGAIAASTQLRNR